MIHTEMTGEGAMMESMTTGMADPVEIVTDETSDSGMVQLAAGEERGGIERHGGMSYDETPGDGILVPVCKHNPFYDDPDADDDELPVSEPPKASCREVQQYLDMVYDLSGDVERPDTMEGEKLRSFNAAVAKKKRLLADLRDCTLKTAAAEGMAAVECMKKIGSGENVEPFPWQVNLHYLRPEYVRPSDFEAYAEVVQAADRAMEGIESAIAKVQQRISEGKLAIKDPTDLQNEMHALKARRKKLIIEGSDFSALDTKLKTVTGKLEKIREDNRRMSDTVEVLEEHAVELADRRKAADEIRQHIHQVRDAIRCFILAGAINSHAEELGEMVGEFSEIWEAYKVQPAVRFPFTNVRFKWPRLEADRNTISDNGNWITDPEVENRQMVCNVSLV